jgi:hypothetical protein
MPNYRVRLNFGKDNGVTVNVESKSEIDALYHVTAHKDWFYASQYLAIDMRNVTYIGILNKDSVLMNSFE